MCDLVRAKPMETHHIHRRYWNTNGMAIAIVAVPGCVGDWAAYIGATTDTWSEETAVAWAAQYGAKLSEQEARFFFPEMKGGYRR